MLLHVIMISFSGLWLQDWRQRISAVRTTSTKKEGDHTRWPTKDRTSCWCCMACASLKVENETLAKMEFLQHILDAIENRKGCTPCSIAGEGVQFTGDGKEGEEGCRCRPSTWEEKIQIFGLKIVQFHFRSFYSPINRLALWISLIWDLTSRMKASLRVYYISLGSVNNSMSV